MAGKLEDDIASMRKRVDVLAVKRTEAKQVFDEAVARSGRKRNAGGDRCGFEERVAPWLTATRDFVAVLSALSPVSFEIDRSSRAIRREAGWRG